MDDTVACPRDFATPFGRDQALNLASLATPGSSNISSKLNADNDSKASTVDVGNGTDRIRCIPGRPDILSEAAECDAYLRKELGTPKLDALYPDLWLVARKSGSNIDALHRQITKGRKILVSEDPKMHLVWTPETMHVKPILECLLNFDFWEQYLAPAGPNCPSPPLQQRADPFERRVALGFLRSYAFLIQHRSDFLLAKEHKLLPEDIGWSQWCLFIANFRELQDTEVAKRYHYGQLRLSRLNWATRLFRPQSGGSNWWYELPYWSTSPYIENAKLILLFIFASISLVLSAMQVMLGSPEADPRTELSNSASAYGSIFWGFSVAVILSSSLALVLLVVLPALYLLNQLIWGFLHRHGNVNKSSAT